MKATPTLFQFPFSLYRLSSPAERYILYDIEIITWLRRERFVTGVLLGSLPQIPSQNVFLGLPLVLQLEEARLLVETGLAVIVNDSTDHLLDYNERTCLRVYESKATARKCGDSLAKTVEQEKAVKAKAAAKAAFSGSRSSSRDDMTWQTQARLGTDDCTEGDEALHKFFDQPKTSPEIGRGDKKDTSRDLQPWMTTPSTSQLRMSNVSGPADNKLPEVDLNSFTLFKNLHRQGYFITPGLRFGCQFSIYPGDPLRFHSHFLATSVGWDEEIDLHDIVGGGRLGTAVKKGWLVGGMEVDTLTESLDQSHTDTTFLANDKSRVRAFCIEWGGM